MDKYVLRNMSLETYQKYVKNNTNDSVHFLVNLSKGHSREIHAEQNEMDLLGRMLSEKKGNVSCFTNVEILSKSLCDIFSYEKVVSKVYDWITKDKIDFKNYSDYKTLAFNVVAKKPVGYGFNNKYPFEKLETKVIRLVLDRDFSDESLLGFYLKTSYPVVDKSLVKNDSYITKTGKAYTYEDMAEYTGGSKDVFSPMERLLYKAKSMGFKESYLYVENGYHEMKVKLPLENNLQLLAFYSENGVKYKLKDFDKNVNKTLSLSELMLMDNPKIKNLVKLSSELLRYQGHDKNDIIKDNLNIR